MKAADVVLSAGGSYDERRALDMLCVEHSKPSLVLAACGSQGSVKNFVEGALFNLLNSVFYRTELWYMLKMAEKNLK